MPPAVECKTHNFIAKTPKPDEATAEELEKMIKDFAYHISLEAQAEGINIATSVLGGGPIKSDNRSCTVTYHKVTPSDL